MGVGTDAAAPVVTPIKIRRTAYGSMQRMLKIRKAELAFGCRRRGRKPKSLTNGSHLASVLQSSSHRDPLKPRKGRGRPPGSKNKPRPLPLVGHLASGVGHLANAEKDSYDRSGARRASVAEMPSGVLLPRVLKSTDQCAADVPLESRSRTVWKLPEKSKQLLDKVCITDVTANAVTVTVRESSTKDGFFRSIEDSSIVNGENMSTS